MERRISHIQDVCQSVQISSNFSCSYRSRESQYSQDINLDQFLREFNTGTIYCYIHKVNNTFSSLFAKYFSLKVASSTWMSYYARLENDRRFLSYAEETGSYYKVNVWMRN